MSGLGQREAEVVCTHCGYVGPAERALTYCCVRHAHFCPRCGYMAMPADLLPPTRRGEATNHEAQAPLPASVSATPEGSQRGRSE